jgi:hypothetical protein
MLAPKNTCSWWTYIRFLDAESCLSVLYKLWESSWRDDAVVLDVERDLYADPDRIRQINHVGK